MRVFRSKFYFFSIAVLHLFLYQGIASAQTATPEPASTGDEKAQNENTAVKTPAPDAAIQAAEDLVHFGDLIDVDVLGSAEYDWRGTLNPEGFLNGINFVEEPIYALCRTREEIAAEVARGFSKLLRQPQVVVKILDRSRRPVSVLDGAVRSSHRFQIQRPVKLNELLILSGGITERASGEIQILRPPNLSCAARKIHSEKDETADAQAKERFIPARQNDEPQFINIKISDLLKGKPEANPFIYGGDTIRVLEAEPVYVIGGVANPGRVITTPGLTVSRAIAAAGGLTKDADAKKITVFRREKNETRLIEVNLEKIDAAPEEDIVLKPLDIIEVGRRGREKNKLPPVINVVENASEKRANPPLRIID